MGGSLSIFLFRQKVSVEVYKCQDETRFSVSWFTGGNTFEVNWVILSYKWSGNWFYKAMQSVRKVKKGKGNNAFQMKNAVRSPFERFGFGKTGKGKESRSWWGFWIWLYMILKRRLEWKSNSIKLVCIVSPFPLFFNAWDAMNQGRAVGMEAWYSSLSAFYPILIPRKGYNFWPLIMPNKIRT